MTDQATRIDLAQLVAAHHRGLYGYAYRLTGSAADAEDLLQQTFLTAQQKREQIRDPESARSWLFTVLRNLFLKQCRRKMLPAEASLEVPLDEMPADELDEGPIDEERVQQAIAELPEEFRLVIAMFYFEDMSYKEIAAELDVPPGTVMSRLSRAKRHLRSKLLGSAETKEELASLGINAAANPGD